MKRPLLIFFASMLLVYALTDTFHMVSQAYKNSHTPVTKYIATHQQKPQALPSKAQLANWAIATKVEYDANHSYYTCQWLTTTPDYFLFDKWGDLRELPYPIIKNPRLIADGWIDRHGSSYYEISNHVATRDTMILRPDEEQQKFEDNENAYLEMSRVNFAREEGLPDSFTMEDMNHRDMEIDRQNTALELGLSITASWDDIIDYYSEEDRKAEALARGLPPDTTEKEMNELWWEENFPTQNKLIAHFDGRVYDANGYCFGTEAEYAEQTKP